MTSKPKPKTEGVPKSRRIEPIANVLIKQVFKWVILCICAFSALQAWLSYRAIEQNFRMTVDDVANTHLPLLAVAIWDIEPEAIDKQINLLLKNKFIANVHIKTSTGQQFSGGDAIVDSHEEKVALDIAAPVEGKGSVGTLELVIDHSILRQELLRSFLLALLEVVVLGVFILTAVVTILRRHLEKPMRELEQFVRNLQANQMSSRLEISRPDRHQYNEIDLVLDGFRSMQESIQQHIRNQDELVQERTQQLEDAMNSLKHLSITDGLTACFNRLLFNERMPGEMQRAARYRRPLSVIFCDIDFFKSVNDQYGHSLGDRVLVEFVACLDKELRTDIDWLVRYGGEEFMVVLPETSLPQAIEVAERMRVSVENVVRINVAGKAPLTITASFGVAEREEGDTVETLVHRADDCLYYAKEHGRNQVQPPLA